MDIIKAIVEKLKLKELFAIVFGAALIITFIPPEVALKLKIQEFRNTYQTYISICIIVVGVYYLLDVGRRIKNYIWNRRNNPKKIAINYMKKVMSVEEMGLLIEKYYDCVNYRFRSSAMIEFSDGRKAALESKYILYRASSMSEWYSFAYNLQPYVLEFLNKNLKDGNIAVNGTQFRYKLM